MKRRDWKILFTGLAFVTAVGNGRKGTSAKLNDDVLRLAALVEEFCNEHVLNASAVVSDEPAALLMDEIVERHIRELREDGETRLPEDRQTLIKLHDRLRHRKARRADREFYAFASEERLADMVLEFLDDELNAGSRAKLA